MYDLKESMGIHGSMRSINLPEGVENRVKTEVNQNSLRSIFQMNETGNIFGL